MNSIRQNIIELNSHIPSYVQLIAVSKTKSIAEIREAISAGQKSFGENKVQELLVKYEQMPEVEWHFIGHLQTNKVKFIAPFVHMIHSVDSLRILQEINKQAAKNNRIVNGLLQIHIAHEETKFGFSEEEVLSLLAGIEIKDYAHIRICGLMGIATNTDDDTVIRNEFHQLSLLFQRIKQTWFSHDSYFRELSMGMSSDYQIAIEEGSTMIRLGSSIFGERLYNV